jgi:CTP:molybdopterin cytidylyltransferase MocA
MDAPALAGLVLAAGAGTRYGMPKALARDAAGVPWVVRAVTTLRAAGCGPVVVALGAAADEAEALVPPGALVERVPGWAEGLSTTLLGGLARLGDGDAEQALVVPVDVPDLPVAAAVRVARAGADARDDALVQAVYAGVPGHPVLLGRAHWRELAAGLAGDRGARPYLRAHGALEVDCADLWSGADVDTPA